MMLEEWRDVDTAELQPLYERECVRWRARLDWDLTPSCTIIEEARRAGRLPGLVVRAADGTTIGWTFFVLHEGVLQMGGLVADSAAALRRMLDRVLRSPEALVARSLSGFLFPISPSVQSAFERQHFTVEPHPYLVKRLDESEPPAVAEAGEIGPAYRRRLLREVDPADIVRLTARAYEGQAEARCFAPDSRLDQWAHYLGQLLGTPACGTYLPEASFAAQDRSTGRVVAAVISTAVSPGTAHIAQIVVDPEARRSGLARQLVHATMVEARRLGACALSLIVAAANAPACRLYAKLGFVEVASFIYASRAGSPRRSFPIAPLAARDALTASGSR